MNTIPRLFEHPTWETIASLSGNELAEFIMLALMSVGVIAAVIYGIYRAVRGRYEVALALGNRGTPMVGFPP